MERRVVAIGEIVEYQGNRYKKVLSKNAYCTGCAFKQKDQYDCNNKDLLLDCTVEYEQYIKLNKEVLAQEGEY